MSHGERFVARARIEWVLLRHASEVAPVAAALRKGWIHCDANEDNILVRHVAVLI